jgi:hypothetical protein
MFTNLANELGPILQEMTTKTNGGCSTCHGHHPSRSIRGEYTMFGIPLWGLAWINMNMD